jgi:hypothetical protein
VDQQDWDMFLEERMIVEKSIEDNIMHIKSLTSPLLESNPAISSNSVFVDLFVWPLTTVMELGETQLPGHFSLPPLPLVG